jgi:hypothetical protein
MRIYSIAIAAFVIGAGALPAQDRLRLFGRPRDCTPCPPTVVCPPSTQAPSDSGTTPPSDVAQPPTSSPFNEALASAGESGTQPAASYMPGFFGDLLPSTIFTAVFIPEQNRGTLINSINAGQSAPIKLAESDSPMPMNRVYYLYNFYGAVQVNAVDPTAPSMNVNRHVIGFEKTLFGGDASVGLRLPFFSLGGETVAYDTGFVGDLTIITKYALINNRKTGNVFTVGLALTVPTGGSPGLLDGNGARPEQPRYRDVNLEPYFGYVYNVLPKVYVHGFHSINVPTDSNDVTFMSNSVGLGWYLFRDPAAQFIQAFIPTLELHVNTPFDHRTVIPAIGETLMLDSVNLTMGAHIVLPRSEIGGAIGVPLAWGPQRIEALATYTLKY